MLDRLEQITMEESYSRVNMRNILKANIEQKCSKLPACKQLLADFLAQEFSFSRKDRLTDLSVRILKGDLDGDKLVLDLLSIILITEEEQDLVTVAGMFAPHLEYENIIDGVKVAADIAVVICESDLYDMYQVERITENGYKNKHWVIKSNYKLDQKTINAINRVQFLPPMLIKPDPIESNDNCGFLTMKEHCVLKKHNHHNLPINLEVLNIMNSTPLCLDEYMLEFEKEFKWKNKYDHKSEADIEKIKSQFAEQQKLFVDTYNELLDHGNNFYLLWRYDSRGRFYPKGYQINPQGQEYDKALVSINIHESVEIPKEYL